MCLWEGCCRLGCCFRQMESVTSVQSCQLKLTLLQSKKGPNASECAQLAVGVMLRHARLLFASPLNCREMCNTNAERQALGWPS